MATIRKREGKNGVRWNVMVRRDGQTHSATFRTKSEAQAWASVTEGAITEGKYLPTSEAKRKTVKDMLERYIEFGPASSSIAWVSGSGFITMPGPPP